MSSEVSFRGVWAKIDRAREHLEALESEVGSAIKPNMYAALGELNAEGTEYVLRCQVTGHPDLLRAGLIFGDAIQNLRNALDHTICQLVIASGGKVSNQHQFPTYSFDPFAKSRTKRRWEDMTRGVDARFMKVIEEVQPYKASEPDRLPLAILATYSNADKHQVIVPVALGVSEAISKRLGPVLRDLEVTGQATLRHSLLLEDGAEVMRLGVRVTGPDPHVEMQGYLPVSIAFGEDFTTAPGIAGVGTFVSALVKELEGLI